MNKFKYTLYCEPGTNFVPGIHYLRIGVWFCPVGMVVLQHGIMPEEKQQILEHSDRIAVFYDTRFHTISIENTYDERYYKRQQSDEDLQQFAGFLFRDNDHFEGRLNLK